MLTPRQHEQIMSSRLGMFFENFEKNSESAQASSGRFPIFREALEKLRKKLKIGAPFCGEDKSEIFCDPQTCVIIEARF